MAGIAQPQRQFVLCCGLIGSGLAPPLFIVLPLFWGALARCKPTQSSCKQPGFVRANSFLPNLCLTCEALDDVFENISNICHAVIFDLLDILWHHTSLILSIHTRTYDIIPLKRHGNTLHYGFEYIGVEIFVFFNRSAFPLAICMH